MMLSMAATALAQVEGDEDGTNQTGFRNTTSIESIGPEISNGGPWYENSWIIVVGLIASLITIGSLIFWIYTNMISKGKNKTELEIKVSESSSAVRISNIPLPHNPNFTGRVDLLEKLEEALAAGERAAFTQTSTITGLGGVGKTQLALEYSYRHADDYQVVWWVRSEEPATLASDYAGLAARLNLPEKDSQDQRITVEAVRRWLEENGGWLLVFDNAQNFKDLEDYLPRSGSGHVIITSRNQSWGGVARLLPVDIFTPAESVEFLRRRTGQKDEDAAKALAEALGNLPLALEQAGAYIEETGISLSAYLKLFQERQKELLSRAKPDAYPDTVATTWDLSFLKASEDVPASADLLNLCAFLAPDDIPKSLLIDGAEHMPEPLASAVKDEMAFNDAVAALKRYSLLTVTEATLSVHRLIQVVARDRLSEKERKRWADAAIRLVNKAFPQGSDDVRTWDECSVLLPHALAAAVHAEELDSAQIQTQHILNQAGLYLKGRAELKEAKALFERALPIAENVYGQDHIEVATIINNLGAVLMDMGEMERAKEHYERALEIDENALPSDNPAVARDVNNLGLVLMAMGDMERAKELFERSLRISEQTYGPDHPKVAVCLNNLGLIHLEKKMDMQAAKGLFERAQKISEKAFGPDHPQVAIYVSNSGSVLHAMGDQEGAKERYYQALKIFEKRLGEDHPYTKNVRENLESLRR